MSARRHPSEDEVLDWCIVYLAKTFELLRAEIDPRAKFAMDSVTSISFVVEMEEWLGFGLSPDIVYEHPTPAKLARYVARHMTLGLA